MGRARLLGVSTERYENDDRHNLYRRYLRIIAVHKPPVFCMENVKGLLSAKRHQKLIFAKILRDLDTRSGQAPQHVAKRWPPSLPTLLPCRETR